MSDAGAPQAKPKYTIELEGFHALRRNTLRGFATVVVKELKLRISDISIHERRPALGIVAAEAASPGRPARSRRGGEAGYATILAFTDGATARAFSRKVIGALETFEPDAFSPDEEPTA